MARTAPGCGDDGVRSTGLRSARLFAVNGLSRRSQRARAAVRLPADRRCSREVACRHASGETAPCGEIDFPACGRTQLRRRAPDEPAPTTSLFPDSNDSVRPAYDVAQRLPPAALLPTRAMDVRLMHSHDTEQETSPAPFVW